MRRAVKAAQPAVVGPIELQHPAVFSPATQPSKGRLTGSVNGYDSHLDPILLVRQSTAMPSKETG
jgi:hypothetical protein